MPQKEHHNSLKVTQLKKLESNMIMYHKVLSYFLLFSACFILSVSV